MDNKLIGWMYKVGYHKVRFLHRYFFIIFVNLIDANLTSRLWKFADDIKLAKAIASDGDKRALQTYLDTLFNWTEEWQIGFNVDKCKVLKLWVGDVDMYNLNGKNLQNVQEERDLGVLMTDDLNSLVNVRRLGKKLLRYWEF